MRTFMVIALSVSVLYLQGCCKDKKQKAKPPAQGANFTPPSNNTSGVVAPAPAAPAPVPSNNTRGVVAPASAASATVEGEAPPETVLEPQGGGEQPPESGVDPQGEQGDDEASSEIPVDAEEQAEPEPENTVIDV